MKQEKHTPKNDMSKIPNWLAILAIVPAVVSIMAYELLAYMVHVLYPGNAEYNPLVGLGMLVPMALMMELITFFYSHHLYKKVARFIQAIRQVGDGDFDVTIDPNKAGPLYDVAESFNKMTEELRSVQTLRRDFINDFSHEFKTPITSINGFANLLLDTEVTEDERREYLTIIAQESGRLAQLAQETMMMSRLDSQLSIPDKELYSLDEQIRQSIILLSPQWNEKKIHMDADLEEVNYNGNAELMTHIWTNLLSNAVKFTPPGGSIRVTMHAFAKQITVCITDSGIGMTKDQLERIFNKYYQGDTSHASKGLGLGLSIARRIVELNGGQLTAASTLGEGSSFTVQLPYL